MPLLLIAVMTHVIYRAIWSTKEWATDASGRAWSASMARSRAAGERIRQRITDTLDNWDKDPRGRRYAATAVRMALGAGRLLGKLGLGSLLMGAKAVGAVARGLGGGALATAGLLGALAQAGRWGAKSGSEWWAANRGSKKWSWADWWSGWATNWANRWKSWGETVPSEATDHGDSTDPDWFPFDEDDWYREQERRRAESAEEPAPEPQADPVHEPNPESESQPEWGEPPNPRGKPAGETTFEWGQPVPNQKAEEATTPEPTPVRSIPAGNSAPLPLPASEGDSMTTLVPTSGSALAPAPVGAMRHYEATTGLNAQAARAASLGDKVNSLVMMIQEVRAEAKEMQGWHGQAEAGLAGYGITAPNVADVVSMLFQIAEKPSEEIMVAIYLGLDHVEAGCRADAQDLDARFGESHQVVVAERIDPTYLAP